MDLIHTFSILSCFFIFQGNANYQHLLKFHLSERCTILNNSHFYTSDCISLCIRDFISYRVICKQFFNIEIFLLLYQTKELQLTIQNVCMYVYFYYHYKLLQLLLQMKEGKCIFFHQGIGKQI
jgi:hypothetical protein